jgi:hypothetical protein
MACSGGARCDAAADVGIYMQAVVQAHWPDEPAAMTLPDISSDTARQLADAGHAHLADMVSAAHTLDKKFRSNFQGILGTEQARECMSILQRMPVLQASGQWSSPDGGDKGVRRLLVRLQRGGRQTGRSDGRRQRARAVAPRCEPYGMMNVTLVGCKWSAVAVMCCSAQTNICSAHCSGSLR